MQRTCGGHMFGTRDGRHGNVGRTASGCAGRLRMPGAPRLPAATAAEPVATAPFEPATARDRPHRRVVRQALRWKLRFEAAGPSWLVAQFPAPLRGLRPPCRRRTAPDFGKSA